MPSGIMDDCSMLNTPITRPTIAGSDWSCSNTIAAVL